MATIGRIDFSTGLFAATVITPLRTPFRNDRVTRRSFTRVTASGPSSRLRRTGPMTANLDPVTPYRPPGVPEAGKPRRVGTAFLVTFGFANLGLWIALLTPVIVSLQLKIDQIAPDNREAALSLTLGVGAVLGMLSNPIFGRLSDRTTSRFGMRRPWLIGSTLVAVAGAAVVGAGQTVAVVTVGYCITQIALNALMAAMMALLPDQVPPHRRGSVSGFIGVGQALAAGIGAGLANGLSDHPIAMFVVPAIIALAFVLVLAISLKDRRLDPAERPPLNLGELARSFWVNPRRQPDFAWAWVSRFMIFMAISCVLNYQVFYLNSRMGLSTDEAAEVILGGILAQTAAVIASSNLVGWLSDRLGRRRLFVCVSALIASGGLLTLAVADSLPQFYLAMVLTGLGQGTYFAVDLALVTDVLPDSRNDAAKDLGVINIANTLPQSLAPAMAPALLALGGGDNYTALFVAGTVFAVLAGVSILKVSGAR
ncbi:MFS transporter [Actinoplanes sp. NPDC026619]|uniref:MFS transporter n=1 Tax=Actinoplanes sp. NPDC026619 TaxID=3155798 RepID=UPI0033CB4E70